MASAENNEDLTLPFDRQLPARPSAPKPANRRERKRRSSILKAPGPTMMAVSSEAAEADRAALRVSDHKFISWYDAILIDPLGRPAV